MDTPEIILTGGAVIKLLIDFLKQQVPESRRYLIPWLAIVLGLAWSFAFYVGAMSDAILRGLILGTGSVGINELVSTSKKKS